MIKLKKSLYGLKQSQKQWNKQFDKFNVRIGFERFKYDTCVYLKFIAKDNFIVLLYV